MRRARPVRGGLSCLVLLLAAALLSPVPVAAAPAAPWGFDHVDREQEWAAYVDGPEEAYGLDVATNGKGWSVYATHSVDPVTGDSQTYLSKYKLDGRLAWTEPMNTPGFDGATAVAARGSAIVVGGWTYGDLDGPNRGLADGFVRRYRPSGDLQWGRQLGSAGSDRILDLAVDGDRVVVVGFTTGALHQPNAGGRDIFVEVLDLRTGRVVGGRQFGSPGNDEALAVAAADGNIHVGGFAHGELGGSATSTDADAVLISLVGGLFGREHITRFGMQSGVDDEIAGLAATADRVYVAGHTDATAPDDPEVLGHPGIFVASHRLDGSRVWLRQLGSASSDRVNGLTLSSLGNLLVAGYTSDALPGLVHQGRSDSFVVELDPDGDYVRANQFGTSELDGVRGVAAGDRGVFVTGFEQDADLSDMDAFVQRLTAHRPDAMLRRPRGAVHGNDAYVPERQRLTVRVRRGQTKSVLLRAQNDGELTERLRVRACGNPHGLRIRWRYAGRNVTRDVKSGRFNTRRLQPFDGTWVRIRIKARRSADLRLRRCGILVTSATRLPAGDRIALRVRVRR